MKLRLATPILEFGTVKPRGVIPVGRKVKVSSDIQLVRIGLTKSVDCKHGTRMDWFMPAPATCLAAQEGRIIVHRFTTKRRIIISIILVYVRGIRL